MSETDWSRTAETTGDTGLRVSLSLPSGFLSAARDSASLWNAIPPLCA